MKKYSKPISIFARITEVCAWVGTALMALSAIVMFIVGSTKDTILYHGFASALKLDVMGIQAKGIAGSGLLTGIVLLCGAVSLGLLAMCARNICLISRSLIPNPQTGEAASPFTPDNVRMVREIGIFSISIALTGLIGSWILRLAASLTGVPIEVSASMNGISLGLVVLYLSSIFSYGVHLQQDVDGLV